MFQKPAFRTAAANSWLVAVSCALLFMFSLNVRATENITGTFTGKLSGDQQCYPDFVSEPFSADISLEFTQTNGSFTGTGTFSDSDGDSGSLSVSGSIDPGSGSVSGSLSGTGQNGETFSGTFSGILSGDSLTLDVSSQDDDPTGCFTELSGTLQRVTGDLVVNPSETPSSTVTNTILNTIQVQAVTNDISNRVGDALRGRGRGFRRTTTGLMFEETIEGRNAGDGISGFGLWSSYSYSDFDNDLSSTALDGSRHSILAGVDISPWDRTLFGVAVGYENSDIDTGFNNGNQQSDGFTIAPYAGFLLTDLMSVDASLGYSRVSVDQYRTDPATGARINSDPASDRWFAMANFNLFKAYRQWFFGAQFGHLYMRNTQNSFIESNGVVRPKVVNKLSQLHLSGDVAYSLGQFEPFARLTYEYDYSVTRVTVVGGGPQPSNDDDGLVLGLGVRYFSSGGISGNLEWNKRLDRDNFDEDIFMLTIRGEF